MSRFKQLVLVFSIAVDPPPPFTTAYGLATTSNYALYGWGTGPIPPTVSNSTPSHFSQTYASLTKVNLPQPVAKVSCGTMHAACITINGVLYTWGSGDSGRLGHGDTTPRAYPTAVKLDGCAFEVSCGERHCAVVVEANEVRMDKTHEATAIKLKGMHLHPSLIH